MAQVTVRSKNSQPEGSVRGTDKGTDLNDFQTKKNLKDQKLEIKVCD